VFADEGLELVVGVEVEVEVPVVDVAAAVAGRLDRAVSATNVAVVPVSFLQTDCVAPTPVTKFTAIHYFCKLSIRKAHIWWAYLVEDAVRGVCRNSNNTLRPGEGCWNLNSWLTKAVEAGLLNGRQEVGPVSRSSLVECSTEKPGHLGMERLLPS